MERHDENLGCVVVIFGQTETVRSDSQSGVCVDAISPYSMGGPLGLGGGVCQFN